MFNTLQEELSSYQGNVETVIR